MPIDDSRNGLSIARVYKPGLDQLTGRPWVGEFPNAPPWWVSQYKYCRHMDHGMGTADEGSKVVSIPL